MHRNIGGHRQAGGAAATIRRRARRQAAEVHARAVSSTSASTDGDGLGAAGMPGSGRVATALQCAGAT